jgi:hypothetical protein
MTKLNLTITPRAAALALATDPELATAFRVRGEGPAPTVREEGDRIEIGYTLAGRLRALSPRRGSLSVELSPAVPWAIELRGGVSGLRAQLADLQLTELAITGGASDVVLDLPRPRGKLAVRVVGGASGVTVRRPAGVPVAVEIVGGAADLRLDGARLGAVGGLVREQTPGDADDEGEIAVHVLGGASRLSVEALDA